MTDEKRKPCGEYHPLPCGLDEWCPVPVEYHDVERSNEQIVEHAKSEGEL